MVILMNLLKKGLETNNEKSLLLTFVLIVFVILALSISILSTIGIETKQFNEIVTKKLMRTTVI